jgi:hypothetical protein
MTNPRLFLSYSRDDRAFVRRLGGDLQTCGARLWIDESEILVGDSLLGKVGDAIDEMDFLVVILSPNWRPRKDRRDFRGQFIVLSQSYFLY